MPIFIEIPDQLKNIVPSVQELLKEVGLKVEQAQALGPVDYEAFEERIEGLVAAVECSAHEIALSALDVDAQKVHINGQLHYRVGRFETTFMTKPGPVSVTRALFRPSGQRKGLAVDLVALRVGAVDGVWLPNAAKTMAHLLQQGTSREAEATARQIGRVEYSRSSFERVGHAVGQKYLCEHQRIERDLIEGFTVPREVRSLSVSLDRVAVPMEEPKPRRVGRPRKDAAKRPVNRAWRMAYCGTVTLHDALGDAVHTIRYGTMPGGDPAGLCMGLADDVQVLLTKSPYLSVSMLCDGAPEMWNLLEGEFRHGLPGGVEVHQLVDYWHLIEKLSPAAQALFGDEAARKELATWKARLLNQTGAAARILDELRASGKDTGDTTCPVHKAVTYLENHSNRLNYAAARKAGRPIGSGNVEATCKSLVAVRMKRSGARWKTHTGEHILHLRALALSDRWDAAIDITLRPPRAVIRRAA